MYTLVPALHIYDKTYVNNCFLNPLPTSTVVLIASFLNPIGSAYTQLMRANK